MFFCEPCRLGNGWPESMAISYGKCEVCGNTRPTYDVPTSALPAPTERGQDMNEDEAYPNAIAHGFKRGDRVRVTDHYSDERYHRDGSTAVVVRTDITDDHQPVRVRYDSDGDETWVHRVVKLDDGSKKEIPGDELAAVLDTHGISFKSGLAIIALLKEHGVEVKF